MAEILHQLIGSLSHYLQGFKNIQPVVVWDFWTINNMSKQEESWSHIQDLKMWFTDSLRLQDSEHPKRVLQSWHLGCCIPPKRWWIHGIQDLAQKTRRETTTNWEIFGKQNGHKLQLPGVRKTPKLLKISSEFASKQCISNASCYQTSSINSTVFFSKRYLWLSSSNIRHFFCLQTSNH